MQKTLNRFATGTKLDEILAENPPGFKEASAKAREFIAALKTKYGGSKRLILGGFSQGAILSVQTSLDLEIAPDTTVLLSATIVNGDEWQQRLAERGKDLTIIQSHGRSDQLLPFVVAQKLHGILQSSGAKVEWVEFSGAHSIAPAVLPKIAAAVERLLQ